MSGGPLDIKPLLWSKLDSRPLPDWEDEPPEPAIEFKHGDVIRPKVGVQTRRLMVVTDHLAWDLNDAYPLQDTTVPYGKHNWVKVDED
jgi:hypothetical protein